MRLIYFGMPGRLSGPPLLALLAAGFDVAALVVPAPPGAPPLAELPRLTPAPMPLLMAGKPPPPSAIQVAAARGLPVLAASRAGAGALAAEMAARGADLACVVCWPWRLPPELLAVPRHGFFNLHPSLLPDLRGPEPLFWAFREGHERSGVTLHQMDAGLDTGPIALQAELALPAGMRGAEAEGRAAELGAELLVEALGLLERGRLALRPQGPGGRYLPLPSPADFAIGADWPARRAFGFMCGTAEWGLPYPLEIGGAHLLLGEALAYEPVASLGRPYERSGELVRVQMAPGVLTARLAPGDASSGA